MWMPTRRQVDALRRALATVSGRAQREVAALWAGLDWAGDAAGSVDALATPVTGVVNAFGDVAATEAADWTHALVGGERVLVSRVDEAQVLARLKWGTAEAFKGDPDRALNTTLQIIDHMVSGQGKQTVAAMCEKNGVRFARVPSSVNACDFCIMLASRGFDYATADAAGRTNKFHANCSCLVVPDDGRLPAGYDPDAFYRVYEKRDELAGLNKRLQAGGLPMVGHDRRADVLAAGVPSGWSGDDVMIAAVRTLLEPDVSKPLGDSGRVVSRRFGDRVLRVTTGVGANGHPVIEGFAWA